MKIVGINCGNTGSTGIITKSISQKAKQSNIDYTVAYPDCKGIKKQDGDIVIGNYFIKKIIRRIGIYTGYLDCFSVASTKRLITQMSINNNPPNIIHLHNLHSGYLSLPILFRYIKKHNIPVVWTLHDCWSFTGRCPHFTMIKCDKWRTGCYKCPYPKNAYPATYIDRTKTMYKLKKKWFTGIRNMTIVTPSQWLADLVKQSYLKEYPIKVINNGIDLKVFQPTESTFREKHGVKKDDFMLLGVAFGWGVRKGLDVFIELSNRLPENYKIVLVGTDANTDKQLPENIISIHCTQNQTELAEIYSSADLFVNPTREENYPTVNMESLACGTPVLTFGTGGSPEIIDETCGMVVACDDIDAMEREIKNICEKNIFTEEACVVRAKQFDRNDRFQEYIDLYKDISKNE